MSATIGLATADDDAALRALVASEGMPGRIGLRYRREPDYFHGCSTMGPFYQVLVAREGAEVAGLACRAVRQAFVNGEERPLGYLSQLRVGRRHQGRWFLSRGFRFLRELHADGRTAAYVTTIVEGNSAAAGLLVEHPRRGMPRYRFVDRLHTLALMTRVWPGIRMWPSIPMLGPASRNLRLATGGAGAGQYSGITGPGIGMPGHMPANVRSASIDDLPDIVRFLRFEGSRRQFFPVLSIDDFRSDVTRGLQVEDFLLITQGGSLAGVCALWDQSTFKQTTVDHYEGLASHLRPLYNLVAPVLGKPRLPPPGSTLRTGYASFLVVKDDDPSLLGSLLGAALRVTRARGMDYVVASFSGGDPQLAVARRFAHIPYRSDIYTVAWDDGASFHDQLDGRPSYLDPATL